MDNTNLFTSSSDGSFQVNTNFANERMTNLGVNRAHEGFDREMEARETAAVNTALQEAKPALPAPHNKEPKTMTQEERHAALQIIDQRMQSAGIENRLRGDSDRNPILGEITDGFRNIGQAFGVGNRVSGESGFVDADGKFHPRTCFTKGTLVTKLKAKYYEEARNGGLTPDARYEEKVAIETIKAGDFVLSFDENTKVKSYKKVTELFHHEVELLYNLELASGEIIETTWSHPFYVVREEANKRSTSLTGGWVEAKDLKAGDKLLNASGNIVQLKSSSEQIQEESISVYNFEVEDNHSYYVGDNGVLVHNYLPLIVAGGIVFFTAQEIGEGAESPSQYLNRVKDNLLFAMGLRNLIKNPVPVILNSSAKSVKTTKEDEPKNAKDRRLADLKNRQADQDALREEQARRQNELANNRSNERQPQPSQQQQGLFDKIKVFFGKNANQDYHTFRHVDDAGLSRERVQEQVLQDIKNRIDDIEPGKPFNQPIVVDGVTVIYTAFKLPNGEVNIGRIVVPE